MDQPTYLSKPLDLNSVPNLRHRRILLDIFNTPAAAGELSRKYGLARTSIYAIAERYLGRGFMAYRRESIKVEAFEEFQRRYQVARDEAQDDEVQLIELRLPEPQLPECAASAAKPEEETIPAMANLSHQPAAGTAMAVRHPSAPAKLHISIGDISFSCPADTPMQAVLPIIENISRLGMALGGGREVQ